MHYIGIYKMTFYDLSMNNKKIKLCAEPTISTDVATKNYVDARTLADVLTTNNSAGSSAINMNNNKINLCGEPSISTDVATKNYVDTTGVSSISAGNNITITGGTTAPSIALSSTLISQIDMGTNKITNCAEPTISTDVATKNYVDTTYWIKTGVNLTYNVTGFPTPTGFVGIGTANPTTPLHVEITDNGGASYNYGNGYMSLTTSGGVNGPPTIYIGSETPANTVGCSIYGNYGIVAGYSFSCSSDKRIKTNITELNKEYDECFKILKMLNPVKYDYIDKKLPTKYCGFIAQDVQKVLPNSVSKMKNDIENFSCFVEIKNDVTDKNIFISNFYHMDNCPNETIKFYPNHDNKENEYKTVDGGPASDANGNQHFLIKLVNTSNNTTIDIYTSKIINDKQFIIDSTYEKNKDVKINEGIYYLIGQQVDDFLVLNDSELISILTACFQEIEKEQQSDKARILELETKVAEQQSIINSIIDRLNNFGA